MEANSNICPVCKTEYGDHNREEAISYFLIFIVSELKKENLNLKKENQSLQERLEKYENTNISENTYNNLADNKIQELLNHFQHPLVVEAIIKIINDYSQAQNNKFQMENQENLINKEEEYINHDNGENLDETKTDDEETKSIADNYTEYSTILTLHEQQLVNSYKNPDFDFQDFPEWIIKVSEPEESQTKRWGGSKEATIFQRNRQGNYWIINIDDCSYIVPQRKFKINEYNQETLLSTFDCRGYQSGKSENFVLVKPGKVTVKNQYEWQLIDPGILQF